MHEKQCFTALRKKLKFNKMWVVPKPASSMDLHPEVKENCPQCVPKLIEKVKKESG
jgi:hypothetical protein